MQEDPVLAFLGPRRVQGGLWYTDGAIEAHSLGADVALTATLKMSATRTQQHLCDSTEIDLRTRKVPTIDWDTPVGIWQICALKASTSFDYPVAWRTNYVPKACQEQQEAEDRIIEAYGGFKGAVQVLPAGFDAKYPTPEYALKASLDAISFLNPHWLRATALLNRRNVMNGLVEIPPDVCAAHPVLRGNMTDEVRCWYAVPPNHVFALNMDRLSDWSAHRDKRVPKPIPLRTTTNHLICYLLSDKDIAALVASVMHAKRTQLDVRPLRELCFEIGFPPNVDPASVSGRLLLGISLCYTTWQMHPHIDFDSLLPTLPKGLV